MKIAGAGNQQENPKHNLVPDTCNECIDKQEEEEILRLREGNDRYQRSLNLLREENMKLREENKRLNDKRELK